MICSSLTREEHEKIHSFCRHLFTIGDVDGVRRESLLFFERQFGAEKSNFFMAEAPDKPVSFLRIVNRGIEDRALRHYRQYYWRIDPFYRKYAEQKPSEISDVLTTEDILSYKKLTRTEYYNDFLKPQSIHHQMTVHLKSGFQILGVVALFRSRRASGFSTHDKLKALLAAPYLSGALKAAIVSEKNTALESVIHSLIPDLPYSGLIIFDRFLEPIYKDERAISILSTLGVPGREFNSRSSSGQRDIYGYCKKLLGSFEGKENAGARELQFDLFSEGSRQKVSVRARLIYEQKSGPLYLLFFNPEEHILGMTKDLRSMGLTRREVEVVHLLAKGSKNAEIAERLCISEYTVENHLRSIYRKMGVSNRTAVVHQLLQILPDDFKRRPVC